MRIFNNVKAVLLDMDGTLVDSDAAVERSWRVWSDEYGVDPAATVAIMHGAPAPTTVRRLRPDLADEQVERAAARDLELQYDDLADVTATTGAALLVRTLNRLSLPWAVVTSADARLAEARLTAAGLAPPLVVTVEDVVRGKPEPDGYLLAADRLGVDAAACLVVEDSETGLSAGRAAGAATASLRGLDADLRLTDLGQLARLLDRANDPRGWWADAVGYQIYLPSFADANGDGWGDLPGVTQRLDHLAGLGVDMLWLTPFFASPMRDHGYDIADYRAVDDSFGGEAALDELVDAAHRRGLRVIGDLVVNHTSDRHRWFRRSASSRDDPYRDYYIWRDPAPDGGPPNNWLSHFGGPAWTFDGTTGQYYLHLFKPEQPDLNWRNPAVADEIDAIIEHWLARGVDGFRIDTAAYLLKHPDLPDNPVLPPGQRYPMGGVTAAWGGQDHVYDIHQPDVVDIHQRWRRVADQHGAFLVGEIYELEPAALSAYLTEERLHSAFWFGLVDADFDARRTPAALLAAAGTSARLSWAQGNHDRPRAASRFGGGEVGRRRSLALHVVTAFLPGTWWLYQGEELGLVNGAVPAGQGADPLGSVQPDRSRDTARTPMPWDDGPGMGFSTGTPWLPLGGRTAADTVGHQETDPASPLCAVRRLVSTRGAVLAGLPDRLDKDSTPDGVVGYRRGRLRVLANFGDAPSEAIALGGAVVFDTDDPDVGPDAPGFGPVRLAPQQAIVVLLNGGG